MRYLLTQEFRYEYPGPIRDLQHRLVVAPPSQHGDQRRIVHRLRVEPYSLLPHWDRDAFGNLVTSIEARWLSYEIALKYEAVIERGPEAHFACVEASEFTAPRYREPSRLTAPDAALRDAADELGGHDEHGLALAARICAFVHARMRYAPDTTTVDTTAAQAFALGSGVCQDFAHIMLALCRVRGVPARYVSGHLIGEGGTHAWVEVIDDGAQTRAVPFDPTHDRHANLDYVFIAAGRDYADVAPTSGSFNAPYVGRFTSQRSVAIADDRSAA